MDNQIKIFLASTSPRRIELLKKINNNFEILKPEFEEKKPDNNTSPEIYVIENAKGKVLSVKEKVNHGIIIGADTIVVLDGKIYLKPQTEKEALATLKELQGKWHTVYTGITVYKLPDKILRTGVERTEVLIKQLNDEEIEKIISKGEWKDKAGGYGVQDVPSIVESYKGDYENIVGLPLKLLKKLLKEIKYSYITEVSNLIFPEGEGLVEINNEKIRIRGVIPGDVVEVYLSKKKKKKIRIGILNKILKESKYRVKPLCKHSGECGGCKLQNMDYKAQFEYKVKWVKGLFSETFNFVIEDITKFPSTKIWFYRNKMEFTFLQRKEELYLGLHKPGLFNSVININECKIFDENTGEILKFVRDFARNSGFTGYNPIINKGFWRYFVIRRNRKGDMLVNIVTAEENENIIKRFADEIMDKFHFIRGVYWTYSPDVSDAIIPRKYNLVKGIEFLEEQIGNIKLRYGIFSFLQPNIEMAELIYSEMLKYFKSSDAVLDLYTGTGSIALYISSKVRNVWGIEIDREAIKFARINADINNITNTKFITGDVKRILRQWRESVNTIVIDPPRGGLSKDIVSSIIMLYPLKIFYLSCQPRTMVRDIQWFIQNGFSLKKLWIFDMFPHTGHIETMVLLEHK